MKWFIGTMIWLSLLLALVSWPEPLSAPAAAEYACGAEDDFGWNPLICGNHQGSMFLR